MRSFRREDDRVERGHFVDGRLSSRRPFFFGRLRWIFAFVSLLLASTAVPVLAEDAAVQEGSPREYFEAPPPAGPSSDQIRQPTAEDISAGIAAIENEERALAEWLETPEAAAARKASRLAYTELSAAQAGQLLGDKFAEQLQTLNDDPARALSEVSIVQSAGRFTATVEHEGEGELLESTIPLRVTAEDGELRKLDLSLEATAEGFEPSNPLTSLEIPPTAGEAVKVGDDGLAFFAIAEEEDASGQRFGDSNVLYHDLYTDTDRMVSPTTAGVEFFDQLRSVESPESLRYGLHLPEGAELTSDGNGGAEVLRDDALLARIMPPSATDAQGASVPVELGVEGDSIELGIPHRDGDFAYPILVDPAVLYPDDWYTNNWFNGYGLDALTNGIWEYGTNYGPWIHGSTSCIYRCWGGSNRGLFVSTENGWYPAGTWGRWVYNAPNIHSYISGASLLPFWRDNHGCPKVSYQQPDDYVGLWGDSSWTQLQYNLANSQGYANLPPGWGRSLHVGLTMAGQKVEIPCWRDIMVGGALVYLNDWENPYLNWVQGIPSSWVSGVTPFTITAQAADTGLGVQNVEISPKGAATIPHIPYQSQCKGNRTNPCLTTHTATFNLTGKSFDEGITTENKLSAYDPTGKVSGTYQFTMKVDRTPPIVDLGGQLAFATDEEEGDSGDSEKWDELSLPVYNLKIDALDGSLQSNATKRSGVVAIGVALDGKETPEELWQQSCPNTSCAMNVTYALKVSKLSAGKHTLTVGVTDGAGNLEERDVEFEYVPATGIKDEYVMQHFPLPDGKNHEDEEVNHGPELAVNVMNGNVVYHERDVEVESYGADLEVERFYNSQLPEAEDTEWGDGWTLAQTPDLEPIDTGGSPAPDEAQMLNASGAIEGGVQLPSETGQEEFDPVLQAAVIKEPAGYELRDETGQSAASIGFDEGGRAEELRTGNYSRIDYGYEGDVLSEIAIEDPGSTSEPPDPDSIAAPVYQSSFGAEGSGNGQFKRPADIAIDAQGNIYVVDRENNRIEKFDGTGNFIKAFGVEGTGNGQFKQPVAIAIDPEGDVWVIDKGNFRVQEFTKEGAYKSQFGGSGSGNGKFFAPEGIAIDAKGNIWVTNSILPSRIQKFNSKGEFVKVISTGGSGPGQVSQPAGLDVDPEGNFWVADKNNNRVQEFNEAGEFVRQWQGTGAAAFKPFAIDVDANGTVWVGDIEHNRVEGFTPYGELLTSFGSEGSGAGQLKLSTPVGLQADPSGDILIADTGNNRVQKWLSRNPAKSYQSSFGAEGSGNGQFKRPADIAIDAQGNIYVVDRENNRIEKFDGTGNFIKAFGVEGTGNGQFKQPVAIAIDPEGDVWVIDKGNFRVQEFTKEGAYKSQFGGSGSGNGKFFAPEGIAIDAKGNIWVTNSILPSRIQKFNSKGEFVKVIGSGGSGNGQFNQPAGVDVDPEGNLWVADKNNNRVQEFNEAGEFVRQWKGFWRRRLQALRDRRCRRWHHLGRRHRTPSRRGLQPAWGAARLLRRRRLGSGPAQTERPGRPAG